MSGKPKSLKFSDWIRKRIAKFEDLECDGVSVVCTICNAKLVSTNVTHWREHLRSKKHALNKKNNFSYATFMCDLIFMFSVCNIPLRVLDKEPFRLFWSKYIPQWELPKRTTARRKLTPIRRVILGKFGDTFRGKKIWIGVDKMTDATGNHVVNVVARILDPDGPTPAVLLASRRVSVVNGQTVRTLVVSTLQAMGITGSQVLMLVTDGAECMLQAGQLLKIVFPCLIHVTCLIQGLRSVADEIRKNYKWADALIVNIKQIFMKSTKYVENFRTVCPDIPLPPQPVLARQETWLETICYYHKYFSNIKKFVLQVSPDDSQVISDAWRLLNHPDVESDIHVIYDNYNILLDGINELENSSLSLECSIKLLNSVRTVLQTLKDPRGVRISNKFEDVVHRNPGYLKLCDINRCLSEKGHPESDDLILYYRFTNVTSVDVEQSFSLYVNVFTQRRRRFSEENIETVLLVQMFSLIASESISSVEDS